MKLIFFSTVLAGLAIGTPIQAKPTKSQTAISYPYGSKERKTVLDVVRRPVEKMVKRDVQFYSVQIRAKNGWAYAQGSPRDTRGKFLPIDPLGEGMLTALLQKRGGRWVLLDWGFSESTGELTKIRRRFPRAPRSIFPSMPEEFAGDGHPNMSFNNKD